MGIGEAAGLFAAALWALSSIFYSRAKMTAWEMNFWKNVIATGVFFVQLWIVKSLASQAVFEAPIEAWCWLAGSSIIGILIGDTVYFRSVQILGPRRALVVATASPIFGVIVGYFFMGDTISLVLIFGIGLTIMGVGIVVSDKQAEIENPNIYPGRFMQGVLFGIGGSLCQAVGVGAAKMGMAHGCEALESSFIRMSTAALAGIYLVLINPDRYAFSKVAVEVPEEKSKVDALDVDQSATDKIEAEKVDSKKVDGASCNDKAPNELAPRFRSILTPLTELNTMKFFIPASLIGTWLGIWFYQMAQQYTDTAVVTTLSSTCPIFAIPLVWLLQGHRPSIKGFAGTLIAVFGIWYVVTF